MANKGKLIVISGPSGTGKGTVLNEVFQRNPHLKYSVSATTRAPREGEVDGVQYHFITKADFEEMIRNGKMLEYTIYCDNYYGTPAEFVEQQRLKGEDVVLEIEANGASQVREKCPDATLIFILPPSIEELERRLTGRGTEPPEVIAARIAEAIREIEQADQYDYQVVNEVVETAADEIDEILRNNIKE